MLGAVVIVNVTPLLETPPTVTTTGPLVAPEGTVAVIELGLQLVTAAVVPLNLTGLAPGEAPKPEPLIVTDVPTGPDAGERLVMLGAVVIVNVTPLLETPPTVTTTG